MANSTWSDALRRALRRNRRDAHNRYLQLATVRADGSPAVRTVVFRDLGEDPPELRMVTDARSAKVDEIDADPRGEIAWYFTHTREQFRLRGHLVLTGPEAAEAGLRESLWSSLSETARAQFFWPHPARPVGSADPLVPGAAAPDTFLVVALRVAEVDHLVLRGDPQTRVRWERDESGAWVSEAINP